MAQQTEQIIDWHGRQAEFFAGIGYAPETDDEEKHRALVQRQLEMSKQLGTYYIDREPVAIARIFGVWPDEAPIFFHTIIGGLSFADICSGESTMAQDAERYFNAREVVAYDIEKSSVVAQRERGVDAKMLDITASPPPSELFDITLSAYGASFWASTVKDARNSILHQAMMTRKTMLSGPIVDTRLELNSDEWQKLSEAVRYQRYVGLQRLDQAVALGEAGFSVSFHTLTKIGKEGSGTHSLIARRN